MELKPCPALREIWMQEELGPEETQAGPPNYDVDGIISAADGCNMAARNIALTARVAELEAENKRLRDALRDVDEKWTDFMAAYVSGQPVPGASQNMVDAARSAHSTRAALAALTPPVNGGMIGQEP